MLGILFQIISNMHLISWAINGTYEGILLVKGETLKQAILLNWNEPDLNL